MSWQSKINHKSVQNKLINSKTEVFPTSWRCPSCRLLISSLWDVCSLFVTSSTDAACFSSRAFTSSSHLLLCSSRWRLTSSNSLSFSCLSSSHFSLSCITCKYKVSFIESHVQKSQKKERKRFESYCSPPRPWLSAGSQTVPLPLLGLAPFS